MPKLSYMFRWVKIFDDSNRNAVFESVWSLPKTTRIMLLFVLGLTGCAAPPEALFVKQLKGTLHPSMGAIAPPLVGHIEGKKGMVLKVDGMIHAMTGAFPNQISAALYVNGDLIDGLIYANPCPGNSWHCTITATWWVDLDAAETAKPGTVIGKPLKIELGGGLSTGSGGNTYDASFTAQLLKPYPK